MNLDIFNNTLITILHTSLDIWVRLNLQDLISNYQEELLLSNTSRNFILDLVVEIKFAEDNNDSKLTYFSSNN